MKQGGLSYGVRFKRLALEAFLLPNSNQYSLHIKKHPLKWFSRSYETGVNEAQV